MSGEDGSVGGFVDNPGHKLSATWQHLVQSTEKDIGRISAYGSNGGREPVPLQALQATVQDKLTTLQAKLRDFDLLAEEQDRYLLLFLHN